jgi:hypothetical protein
MQFQNEIIYGMLNLCSYFFVELNESGDRWYICNKNVFYQYVLMLLIVFC